VYLEYLKRRVSNRRRRPSENLRAAFAAEVARIVRDAGVEPSTSEKGQLAEVLRILLPVAGYYVPATMGRKILWPATLFASVSEEELLARLSAPAKTKHEFLHREAFRRRPREQLLSAEFWLPLLTYEAAKARRPSRKRPPSK